MTKENSDLLDNIRLLIELAEGVKETMGLRREIASKQNLLNQVEGVKDAD